MDIEKKVYSKSNINFLIDAFLLVIFSAMIGIGFMIKYVLLTGEQKTEKFGANFEQTILGLDRHGWGDIHLYLGFVILGLLVLHIIFHWKMIIAMFGKFFEKIHLQRTTAVIFLSLCFLFIISPFFIKPQNGAIQNKHFIKRLKESQAQNHINNDKRIQYLAKNELNKEHLHQSHNQKVLNIRGYMSIAELCATHNIKSSNLKEKLGLPASLTDVTRLSTLRKQYGIKMSHIEEVITQTKKRKALN